MSATTISALVVDGLRRVGVRHVFGVPGRSVHALLKDLHFGEAGGEESIRFVVGRHEGASAFMADGYARASGGLGVCLVCSGPGATNAATGVLCAHADHSAVLLLAGESPTTDFRRGGFQCGAGPSADLEKMFAAITGHSELLREPERVLPGLHDAIRCALSPARGAAYVAIPMDVAAAEVTAPASTTVPPALPPEPDVTAFDDAVRCLLGARRPLLLLGSGCSRALSGPRGDLTWRGRLEWVVREVAERHGIPIASTPKAKGLVPEDHPLALGNHGMAGSEWVLRYLRGQDEAGPCDALMVLGSGLSQWATAGFDPVLVPRGPLFHVDVEPSVFGRAFTPTTGIVADAAWALDRMGELARATDPGERAVSRERYVAQRVKAVPRWLDDEKRRSEAHPILPQRVMAELQTVLDRSDVADRGVNLFCDIGNSTGWAWHHLCVRPPHRAFFNTGMGSMGWASGAVIGGKLADQERFAIALSGDGAFFMNGSEVSTAFQYSIAATWIVFQDDNMGMVTQGMNATHESPVRGGWERYYRLGDSDLVSFAASLGADAYGVSAPGELARLLPGLLAAAEKRKKPQVLVVRIDRGEVPPYPHNRPGPREAS